MAKISKICPYPGTDGASHRHFSEKGVMKCKRRIDRKSAKFAKPKA